MSPSTKLHAPTLHHVADLMEAANEGADHLRASRVRQLAERAESESAALDKPTLRHVADMIVALMKGQIDVRELRPAHAKDWHGVHVDDVFALVERMEREA